MEPRRRERDAAAALLVECYRAAVRAAAPGPAVSRALDALPAGRLHRVWIVALGKAAGAMAIAAAEWLARRGAHPAGGIVVAPEIAAPPHPRLIATRGDHPVPAAASFHAAAQLDQVTTEIERGDDVWVLLSGGATSLIAAPEPGVGTRDLRELFSLLLASGIDVAAVNAVRKRFCRWGAGRLAVALGAARVRTYIVSDVIGDDPASIASGPCVPDPTTAEHVRSLLVERALWERVPLAARRYLERVERDPTLETPKPGNSAFDDVEATVIASNRIALEGAATRATELGARARIASTSLSGEAADAGARIAALLMNEDSDVCLVWGGETTVTLGDNEGKGGRCQELALSAARAFAEAPPATGCTDMALLAAGTDGRDGPTDAAGALVDATTWETIRRRGHDPDLALRTHDSYPALDAAGALFRTGLTGTNVADVVIAARCEGRGASEVLRT